MEELDVENCQEIDNRVLEISLSTQRTMKVFSGYTKVDPNEFMVKHKEAVKRGGEYEEIQEYVCGKLTFIHSYWKNQYNTT